MTITLHWHAAALTLGLLAGLGAAAPDVEITPVHAGEAVAAAPTDGRRAVEIAICLDTSGSMSGLIEAAKQKLWSIVNEFAMAEPAPRLRVALLTYGNNGHSEEDGWVRLDVPLTEDLDRVSQQLFSLTTNGGTELVGRVVNVATGRLDWHPSDDAFKLIIVAGNESADQDTVVAFRDQCRRTIGTGVMINSIYCGDPTDGLAPAWREVAALADGRFASIDHDHGTVVVATPFDEPLATLSTRLNETYIPYGAAGQTAWANQTAQDNNAQSLNEAAAAERCVTKGNSVVYCNSTWDLVDACRNKTVELAEVKVEDLPEAMQAMTLEERAAHVAAMDARRTELQAQIQEIGVKRTAFIAAEVQRQQLDQTKSFDFVIRQAIREQAGTKGFRFPALPAPPAPETAPTPPAETAPNQP
ncbi:MAG: VWA domain-containing protein [Phycisphaerales bacterium]|nr:VWA domain-containing protein [Phycisphaerales bacterium]